jgi:hypothetical protein
MAFLLALVFGSSLAFADEPAVSCAPTADGAVQVQAVVPASEANIRAYLDSAVRCGTLAPGVLKVEVVAPRGSGCEEIVTTTKVPGSTMDYRSMRCRTSTGYKDTLMDSETMQDFYAVWNLRTVEGGTEVTVKVKTVLDLPVPTYLVNVGLQSSLKATMLNLISAMGAK